MIPDETAIPQTSQWADIPWSTRDVWVGAALLFGVMMVLLVGGVLFPDLNTSLLLIASELLLLLPIWWLGIRKYNASWHVMGLRRFSMEALAIGCGLMVLSWGFNLVYSLILALFNTRSQPDMSVLFTDTSSPWGILLGGAVFAPIIEEIIFRGFIFGGLTKRYGWVKAAAISSALFALIHMQPFAILPIFILGVIFAFLYQYSGSIWPAVVMHMSSNLLALSAAYLISRMPEFENLALAVMRILS